MSDIFNPKQVSYSFSNAASKYEKHAQAQQKAELELLERIQLLNINPTTILDLGCGTGVLTRALKQIFPKAKVVGADLSEGMIAEAKSKNGWFKKNIYKVANAEALPFEDNYFDLVVSNFMLHWCNDIDAVFKEVNRVLKPDAPMFMTCLGPDTLKEFREIWHELDEFPHVHPFIDMHLIGDGLIKSGFQDPVVDREDLVVHFEKAGAAIASLKMIGAQNQLQDRRKTLTGKNRMKNFQKRYEQKKTEKGYPLTYEIVFMHGRSGELKRQQIEAHFSLDDLKKTLHSK